MNATPAVVGRDPELERIGEFVADGFAPRGLVLAGGPGFGKTTLWEAGVAFARERDIPVACAAPSGAEAQLSFAALIDLCAGLDTAHLPAPQRSALEVALLRREPAGAPPYPHAIGLAMRNLLAAHAPILIAVDDVQWLDRPSAEALAFAARRLEAEPVGFLLARRGARASALEQALARRGVERVDVGPLNVSATRRLLLERLGLRLPPALLRRVVEATLGNPLFALEVGRMLAAQETPADADLPVPDAVEALLGTRVAGLPRPVRRVLLAVALSEGLHSEELEAIGGAAFEDALDAELLRVDGDRVRAAHPLIAAAARTRARPSQRRALHAELADVVREPERRALHLALAAPQPDAALAAEVETAAAAAAARGARPEAVALAEQALRLTPAGDERRTERLLTLAGFCENAGDRQRVTDVLTPELDALPPGEARVRAWLLLSEGGAVHTHAEHQAHLERALAAAGEDPSLRGRVLALSALSTAAEGVERIREAEAWALEALPAGPGADCLALRALGWTRSLRGVPVDDVSEQFSAITSHAVVHLIDSPGPVAALRLAWRGEIQAARAATTAFLTVAGERGEAVAYAWLRLNLCEIELRAGEWDTAERILDEWEASDPGEYLITPTYGRCRALLAAGRGDAEAAERWAQPALAEAESRGYRWQVLEATRALGLAALLAHDPGRAAERLRAVWEHTEREGIADPGAFPVAPDLVEALVELGERAEARAVTARLRALADAQQHPWGLASALRCHALADDPPALEAAAEAHERLGLRFEAARCRLSLGRALRRTRQWGAAREALEAAAAGFDALGSPGWVGQARAELARVGGRRPRAPGELTPAERQVAALAGEGRSNKEIARVLFVTVHTVEAHLTSAYAKLGVRSRAQLASHVSMAS